MTKNFFFFYTRIKNHLNRLQILNREFNRQNKNYIKPKWPVISISIFKFSAVKSFQTKVDRVNKTLNLVLFKTITQK